MATRSATRSLTRSATLTLPEDRPGRLVVVADTHGRTHPGSLGQIEALAPDGIVHAGDIGDPVVLDDLAGIAPLFVVRGNIDPRGQPDVVSLDLERGGGRVMRILVLHIGVNGPRLRADAATLARDAGAQVVICGHSHVPFIGRDRGFVVFNPGSIGPRRFTLPIVYGTLEVGPTGARLAHVNAETGAAWTPA